MRRLAPREHTVVADTFNRLEGYLAQAREAAQTARTGSELDAYIELDLAASSLDDLRELAERLSRLLGRLSRAAKNQKSAHGRTPELPATKDAAA